MNKAELLGLLGGQRETLKRQYAVKSLALFGSAARGTLADTSDVDLLVEFDTAATFDGYFDLKYFLEDLIGRRVDLVTRSGLRSELRARVEQEAIHVA